MAHEDAQDQAIETMSTPKQPEVLNNQSQGSPTDTAERAIADLLDRIRRGLATNPFILKWANEPPSRWSVSWVQTNKDDIQSAISETGYDVLVADVNHPNWEGESASFELVTRLVASNTEPTLSTPTNDRLARLQSDVGLYVAALAARGRLNHLGDATRALIKGHRSLSRDVMCSIVVRLRDDPTEDLRKHSFWTDLLNAQGAYAGLMETEPKWSTIDDSESLRRLAVDLAKRVVREALERQPTLHHARSN